MLHCAWEGQGKPQQCSVDGSSARGDTWHGGGGVSECTEANAHLPCRRSVQPEAEKKRQRYRPLTRPPVETQNADFELRLLEAAARRSQRTLKVRP